MNVHQGECFGNPTQKRFSERQLGVGNFTTKRLKFYLSFENAYRCNDYVSEKFWRNAFGLNLVPIVYGPHITDVMAVAPPNSFIYAESFSSPKV